MTELQNVEFITSQAGGRLVLFGDFRYLNNRDCYILQMCLPRCKSRFTTVGKHLITISPRSHPKLGNNPPLEKNAKQSQRRSHSDSTDYIGLKELTIRQAAVSSSFTNIDTNLYRHPRTMLPRGATMLSEVQLEGVWRQIRGCQPCWSSTRYLLEVMQKITEFMLHLLGRMTMFSSNVQCDISMTTLAHVQTITKKLGLAAHPDSKKSPP